MRDFHEVPLRRAAQLRQAPLPVLPPAAIPDLATLRQQTGPDSLTAIRRGAARIAGAHHVAASAELLALAALLPDGTPIEAPLARSATGGAADLADHDAYFGVQRVTGPAGPLLLRTLVSAAQRFHADMAVAYAPETPRFGAIGRGFATLLACLAEAATRPVAAPPGDDALPPGAEPLVDPVARWVLGHQIFAALTQGLIAALQAFEAAMHATEERAAEHWLGVATDLLLASAASFRFTGDFPPEIYREVIRPSMAPPAMADGFSGLLSADHRYLVQVLVRLRPLMGVAHARHPATHRALTEALHRVYEDHKFVCARFDGANVASLRACPGGHAPGVVQLEGYQRARLRLLRPPRARSQAAP